MKGLTVVLIVLLGGCTERNLLYPDGAIEPGMDMTEGTPYELALPVDQWTLDPPEDVLAGGKIVSATGWKRCVQGSCITTQGLIAQPEVLKQCKDSMSPGLGAVVARAVLSNPPELPVLKSLRLSFKQSFVAKSNAVTDKQRSFGVIKASLNGVMTGQPIYYISGAAPAAVQIALPAPTRPSTLELSLELRTDCFTAFVLNSDAEWRVEELKLVGVR